MSSSGLVVPWASSAARFGKDTSYVPTLLLVSSPWPDPSCRVPFQAVRAVRVGIGPPTGAGIGRVLQKHAARDPPPPGDRRCPQPAAALGRSRDRRAGLRARCYRLPLGSRL